MNEYYKCNICGNLQKKDNSLGNYENYVCNECWEKYIKKGGKLNENNRRNNDI